MPKKIEIKPYKLKIEMLVEGNTESRGANIKALYICDPDKNTECKKTGCGKECKMTANIKYAKHYDIGE